MATETMEAAIEWCLAHSSDPDFRDPVPGPAPEPAGIADGPPALPALARSRGPAILHAAPGPGSSLESAGIADSQTYKPINHTTTQDWQAG